MATTPTSIGPIGARQINNNLFVGRNDLTTIQAAVTFAVAAGGIFTVYVPPEYAGTDTIAAVTGGANTIQIVDQRSAQSQVYVWNGTQFVPEPFIQDSGFISLGPPTFFPAGSTALYFYPAGTNGVGTAHLDFYANPGQAGMPALNLVGVPSDGSALWTFLRCDQDALENPRIQIPSAVEVYTPAGVNNYNMWIGANRDLTGAQGMSIWGRPSANAVDLQGETLQDDTTTGLYNQAIRLNYLGGNVLLGPNITVDTAGDLTGIVNLTASDARFTTCEVANSPVRTFANSPDTAGPTYPPPGIGISTGTAWSATSIDPASLLAYPPVGITVSTGTAWGAPINPASLATYPAAGIAVSTGTAWGTAINPASLLAYPPAGVAVSTGTAWGTAIPAADVARLSVANSFSAAQTFAAVSAGALTARSGIAAIGFVATPSTQGGVFSGLGSDAASPVITWVDASAPADAKIWTATAFSTSTLNFLCFNDAQSANNAWMTVTRAGAVPSLITLGAPLNVTGAASLTGALNVALGANLSGGVSVTGTGTSRASSFNVQTSGGNTFLFITGPNTTTQGAGWIGTSTSTGATQSLLIQLASGLITLNQSTNVAGNFYVSGTINSGGAKGFRIEHPLDETKDLVHVAVEGPECAVFYRGEGVTRGGWAEIRLPDYFEALTMQENRTVLLTALFEEDEEPIGPIAASRVKDGKFRVWSGLPTQKFYWEVKAVRADIEPLEVKIDRGTQFQGGEANR
jgi:hypothetical protein